MLRNDPPPRILTRQSEGVTLSELEGPAVIRTFLIADIRGYTLAAVVDPGGEDLVSKRVGNYQHNPVYDILLDQLLVR